MKFFLSLVLIHILNCSSYIYNRKNDILDIPNISIEKNLFGFGIKILPLNLGFIFQNSKKRVEFKIQDFLEKQNIKGEDLDSENSIRYEIHFSKLVRSKSSNSYKFVFQDDSLKIFDSEVELISLKNKSYYSVYEKNGIGLRNGNANSYHSEQLVYTALGGETFYPGVIRYNSDCNPILSYKMKTANQEFYTYGENSYIHDRPNTKSHELKYLTLFADKPKARAKRVKEKVFEDILENLKDENPELYEKAKDYLPKKSKKPFGYPKSYLYSVEFSAGLYYGFRIGINFSEVLDFLLGIIKVDILSDDESIINSKTSTESIELEKEILVFKKREELCRVVLGI
jgi:hypothetical protein